MGYGLEVHMNKERTLDKSYDEALGLLARGDFGAAINLLHADLLAHPRAAQTVYLFGVSHLPWSSACHASERLMP